MREKVDTDPDLIGRVEFEGKGKGNGYVAFFIVSRARVY